MVVGVLLFPAGVILQASVERSSSVRDHRFIESLYRYKVKRNSLSLPNLYGVDVSVAVSVAVGAAVVGTAVVGTAVVGTGVGLISTISIGYRLSFSLDSTTALFESTKAVRRTVPGALKVTFVWKTAC